MGVPGSDPMEYMVGLPATDCASSSVSISDAILHGCCLNPRDPNPAEKGVWNKSKALAGSER